MLDDVLNILKPPPSTTRINDKLKRKAPHEDHDSWANNTAKRETFLGRWSYTIQFAKCHFVEGLFDFNTFAEWFLDRLKAAHFGQVYKIRHFYTSI
jgi:hypothetical protein